MRVALFCGIIGKRKIHFLVKKIVPLKLYEKSLT